MTVEEEQRIRERAYSIWEQEGRPRGRELDHRLRAEAEIAAERLRGVATGRTDAPGEGHERPTSARQAAEALFTGNREATARLMGEGSATSGKSAPKPRVLPVLPTAAAPHEELNNSNSPQHQTVPEIASSQFARIRTWVRYGMTLRQVADMYGTDVGEIERVLRRR